MTRTAIFLVNGLGDQLIAWPTIRALRSVIPGPMEIWLGPGLLQSLYTDVEMARYGIACNQKTRELDLGRVREDHVPVELFVSLSYGINRSISQLITKLGATRTVGYTPGYDEQSQYPENSNMFDKLFSIARHFDSRFVLEDFAEPPAFSSAAEEAGRRFVDQHLLPGERMLFVHPETRLLKMWSPEGFSRVLVEMLDARPDLRVFLSSMQPYPLALGRHQNRIVEVDKPYEMTLAILRHASLFLGVDSCFLHGADLLRVPGVGLFGPTSAEEWGFRLTKNTRTVSTGGAPLTTLDPHTVLDALFEVDRGREVRKAV